MEVSVAVFEMNMREDYVRRIRDRRSVLYDDIVYSKLYQSSQKIVTRLYYATEPYGSTPTTDCSRQRNTRVLPDARSPGRPRIAGALALSDALVCHPRNRKVICDPLSWSFQIGEPHSVLGVCHLNSFQHLNGQN